MEEDSSIEIKELNVFVREWALITNTIGAILFSVVFSFFNEISGSFLNAFCWIFLIGLLFCIPGILYGRSIVFLLEKTDLNRLTKTYLLTISVAFFLILIVFFTIGEGKHSIFFDYQTFVFSSLVIMSYFSPMIYWIWKKDPYQIKDEGSDSADEFDDILDKF